MQVEQVGEGVTDLAPGDRVFCAGGGHRSHLCLPARNVIPVPAGLTAAAATFARLVGVTFSTLTTTTARPPDLVLITGLGLVGHLGAQLFDRCGYQVIACDPDAGRRALATEAGLPCVLPALPLDDPQVAGQVALVVECSGHEQAVVEGCRLVRKLGEVVLVGVPWVQQTDLPAHALTHAIFHQYAVVRSGWEWQVPRHEADFQAGSIQRNLAAALQWLADGRLQAEGLYEEADPRNIQQVYQNLLHRRVSKLGVVLDWERQGDA
jgi:threonine dehydrogenase-like Zn-dependent dehydrogenase